MCCMRQACLKVNPDSDTMIYPDLISLEVPESEMLSRAAHEQASHVRPTDAAADRLRPEVQYCLAFLLPVLCHNG